MHQIHPTVKPSRVVVLGATGFLARDLTGLLKDQTVPHIALGSGRVDLSKPEAIGELCDLIEPDDSLVVLSALTPEKGRDVATFSKNIAMISHLCAALQKSACRHVIYLSSDAVYGDGDHLISEQTPVSPRGLYPMMHAAREQMLEDVLQKAKVPFCIVRPCAVFGPGDTHNSYGPNRFVRSAMSLGKITLFGGGEEEREHVYVRDVSEFLSRCLVHQAEGIFNVTSGRPISFLELAKLIARRSSSAVQIEYLPRTSPVTHRRFDISLRRRLFPDFKVTDLEDGLEQTMHMMGQSMGQPA